MNTVTVEPIPRAFEALHIDYTATTVEQLVEFCGERRVLGTRSDSLRSVIVHTSTGWSHVSDGHWFVKGGDELYPVDGTVFSLLYRQTERASQ